MPNNQPQHFDVIIVGGGMAGVSTAYHLIMSQSINSSSPSSSSSSSPTNGGFNGSICVLEARNRLGGRIHAVELPSKTVEYGANWIHGVIGNPIYDLAIKYKLVDPLGHEATHQSQGVQGKRYFVQAIREDGKKVDLKILEETYEAYYWFMKQIESYHSVAEKEGKDPPFEFENSAGKHLIRDIEKYLEAKDANDWIQVRKSIFKNLLHREAIISGSHTINDVSLRDFGAYDDFPGGNLIVDAGYISIINVMLDEMDARIANLKEVRNQSTAQVPLFDIQLNQEVIQIKWKRQRNSSGHSSPNRSTANASGSNDINITSQTPDNSSSSNSNICDITCQDGSRYTCHHCVISLPLGVLKETSELMFEPQLPEYKIQSIQSLGFSDVAKVFLEFKNKLSPKFLDPSVNEFILIWADDDDVRDGDNSVGNDAGVIINNNNINLNDPSSKKRNLKICLKTDSPKTWYRTIYSLTKISDYALLCWLSGDDAELVEVMPVDQISKTVTDEVLRKFFHPEFPEPESVFVTQWKSDAFSRGAYTFVSTKSSVRDIEKLSQPIYSDPGQEKPVLLFAGEHCHPVHFSTVHGAFGSGKKAASYLMDASDCLLHLPDRKT